MQATLIGHQYVKNTWKEYACVCEKCKKVPAVQLIADCGGDGIAFCKEHWLEYFNEEILAKFKE